MKKIFLILLVIPVLFTSCTREPYADFIADKRVVFVGEEIYFTNRSADAVDYEWNFDDGYISYNFNAVHSWSIPGFYTVSLTVWGRDGQRDRALMDIEVQSGFADLEITVEEFYEPYYLVEGASVRIYPTLADWDNETNMIVEGFTDSQGKVLFTDLVAGRRYYVDIWGEYHDNWQLRDEDPEFVTTDRLVPGVTNLWTGLVDYYPEGKNLSIDRSEQKAARKKNLDSDNPRKPGERNKPEGIIQEVR